MDKVLTKRAVLVLGGLELAPRPVIFAALAMRWMSR